jgi:hypothetical protein
MEQRGKDVVARTGWSQFRSAIIREWHFSPALEDSAAIAGYLATGLLDVLFILK